MLSIDKIKKIVFEEGQWNTYSLTMTPNGFAKLEGELTLSDKKCPQVYIHTGVDGEIKNKVLRIGKAESGIKSRWFKAKNGHYATFSWAIGESDKYGIKNANDYPHYLLFFANLFEQKTKLHILTCQPNNEGKHLVRICEKILIGSYAPMWEEMKGRYKNFFQENPELKISKYGSALKILNTSTGPAPPNILKSCQEFGRVLRI